jgi:hypothetical protein
VNDENTVKLNSALYSLCPRCYDKICDYFNSMSSLENKDTDEVEEHLDEIPKEKGQPKYIICKNGRGIFKCCIWENEKYEDMQHYDRVFTIYFNTIEEAEAFIKEDIKRRETSEARWETVKCFY